MRYRRRQRKTKNGYHIITGAIILYFTVSLIAYRFRHPKQTETELFINIPQALQWR